LLRNEKQTRQQWKFVLKHGSQTMNKSCMYIEHITSNEQILYVHRTHAQAMNKSCIYIEHMHKQ